MNDTKDYFGDVGVWHPGARNIGLTYILGLIGSLALTIAAYGASVYHIAPKQVLIPFILACACLQFMVQVLGFLHVSGAPSSRARLIALLYCTLMVLTLVLGSMWIMTNLDARMTHSTIQMEDYMQRQQGI